MVKIILIILKLMVNVFIRAINNLFSFDLQYHSNVNSGLNFVLNDYFKFMLEEYDPNIILDEDIFKKFVEEKGLTFSFEDFIKYLKNKVCLTPFTKKEVNIE